MCGTILLNLPQPIITIPTKLYTARIRKKYADDSPLSGLVPYAALICSFVFLVASRWARPLRVLNLIEP